MATNKPRLIDWQDVRQHVAAGVAVAVILAILGWATNLPSLAYRWCCQPPQAPYAQKVRWKSDELGMEIRAEDENVDNTIRFVPWSDLRKELDKNLLPQMFADPSGYRFEPRDHHGKKNNVIRVFDSEGKQVSHLWLGIDPVKHAKDGLVRLGTCRNTPCEVWQTYRRESDGSYTRLDSAYWTLEDACPSKDRPCL
jgi:hypothetical protein